MITDRSERSLSPLGKDPKSIGKFFKSKRVEQQNPQYHTSTSFFKNQSDNHERSPKSIGINTSKAALTAIPIITKPGTYENQNQVKPITHIKIKSPIVKIEAVNNSKVNKIEKNGNNLNVLVNQNLVSDRVPAIVDFPIAYYEQNQQAPQTPDLPNRINMMNHNSHLYVSKQAHINQTKKIQKQVNTQYSEPGIIRQKNERVFSNSAPKDFGAKTNQSFHISSPQLPYINKLENNIQGFRKFVNTNEASAQVASSTQINPSKNYYEYSKKFQGSSSLSSNNSPFIGRKSGAKSIGEILKKNQRVDPEQEQKLEQKKNFRISNNNFYANRMKLPTFRQQNKDQFEQQVNLDIPINPTQGKINKRINYDLNLNNSNKPKNIINEQNHKTSKVEKNILSNSINQNISFQDEQYQPGTLISNSFIRNTAEVQSQNLLIVDLRTSIQKIKQALIQGGEQMAVSFNIPQVFYKPPTSLSTSQQLHALMLQVFSYIGVSPQIVSIKKYINCVVMREKKLCVLWNFNGKIYFGGWKKQQTMSQGNKDGIGIQWVPSRYIYYGEFKDNKKQGYGLMKKSNKQIYIGCWKNNQRWGWGRVYDHNGNLHQNGEFIQGCFIYPKNSFNQSRVKEAY